MPLEPWLLPKTSGSVFVFGIQPTTVTIHIFGISIETHIVVLVVDCIAQNKIIARGVVFENN